MAAVAATGWLIKLTGSNYDSIMLAAPVFMLVALAYIWGVRKGEARATAQ